MIVLALASVAAAGNLNFSPDRPGVGDSTQTVGDGAFMGEVGLTTDASDPFTAGTVAIARYGLGDEMEVRAHLPDMQVAPEVDVRAFGIGWKWALDFDAVEVSFVPELLTTTRFDVMIFNLGGQAAVSKGDSGAWVHTSGSAATGTGDVSMLVGGGVSQALGLGGVYANGGWDGDLFAGPGVWFKPGDAVQIDTGVDFSFQGDGIVPRAMVGASIGL